MCWLPLVLGTVMLLSGAVLVTRFFVGHGATAPQRATLARNESMVLGAALVALGLLLLSLGLTGVLCGLAGISRPVPSHRAPRPEGFPVPWYDSVWRGMT